MHYELLIMHYELCIMNYLKPCFLQIFPEKGITLADNFGVIDAQSREFDARRSKRHGHAMVLIGVDGGAFIRLATRSVPAKFAFYGVVEHVTELLHLRFQGCNAVGFLDSEGLQASEMEWNILQA